MMSSEVTFHLPVPGYGKTVLRAAVIGVGV